MKYIPIIKREYKYIPKCIPFVEREYILRQILTEIFGDVLKKLYLCIA